MASFLRGTLKLALFIAVPLAVILLIIKLIWVDVVTVSHNGMAPTVFAGDDVLMWRGARIDRGDIAVCRHPREPGRFVMARVIATPPASIGMERGGLVVGGDFPSLDRRGEVSFEDTTIDSRRTLRWAVEELGYDRHFIFEDVRRPLRVRPIERLDGLFLLGDHRGYAGEDSRTFGVVQESECVGEVFMLLRPGPVSLEEFPRGWFSLLGP